MDRIDLLKENQDLKKELEKYKKGLDKACKRLVKICDSSGICDDIHCPLEDDNCNEECGMIKYWKEWCMKDE